MQSNLLKAQYFGIRIQRERLDHFENNLKNPGYSTHSYGSCSILYSGNRNRYLTNIDGFPDFGCNLRYR